VEDDGPAQTSPNGQMPEDEAGAAREPRTDAVSQVYAQALLEMAEQNGELQSLADEVEELGQLLKSQPQLKRLLATPTIGHEQRRGVIERVFKNQVSDVLYRFLHVVNDKGRLAALLAITRAFGELMAERNGIVEADIWIPASLAPDQRENLGDRLAKAVGAQQVVIHQYTDPSLIGGMKIRVGDTLIDASVAKQLRQMRQRMIESGRMKAQEMSAVEE